MMLVTGATGFIGRRLVAALGRAGEPTRCFVRPGSRDDELRALGVDIVVGDLRDADACRGAVRGVDAVIHLAGLGLARLHEDPAFNVEGTRALVHAVAEGARMLRSGAPPRFVFLSSIKAGLPADGRATSDPYAASKRAAEGVVLDAAPPLAATIVRAPLVYGPGDRNLLPVFRAAAAGLLPNLRGPGVPSFHALFVDDLVRSLLAAARTAPPGGRIVYVGVERTYSWPEVVRGLYEVQGRRPPRISLRPAVMRVVLQGTRRVLMAVGHGRLLPKERIDDLLDARWVVPPRGIQEIDGGAPTTSLANGMRATWEAYASAGQLTPLRPRRTAENVGGVP
jgi:nucleoside-diphosphate-sugar epimerase